MPILALPQTTVRAIGSSQVLTDPCSVVKELVDNALDARANSIFVEISNNTLDVVQVKDNGHGIAPEDREMVCRRYCTSKLREYSDLRDVAARWLGFRGEALASAAEMAGSLTVMTRVEGENVATTLKVGRMGEVQSQERASHPVGTTIRVSDFFKNLPVRKQTAFKTAAKIIVKIKQTLQAYALARPAVKFSLRVLKAKNDKGNWTYAPNKNAGLADAVLKIFGKDIAGECSYLIHISDNCNSRSGREHDKEGADDEQIQAGGFQIEAFLPRKDADPSKINGQGHYISIDSRPVSCTRGLLKQILALSKDYIRSALSTSSFVRVVNPFVCLNIKCPPGSYDANVEPSKDDVLFEDSNNVLLVMESFLKAVYGDIMITHDDSTKGSKLKGAGAERSFDLLLARKPPDTGLDNPPTTSILALSSSGTGLERDLRFTIPTVKHPADRAPQIIDDSATARRPQSRSPETNPFDSERPAKRRRTWRFNMYGGDEEDVDDPAENNDQNQRPPIYDEPEVSKDVGTNNPWIIAKMNAPVRPKRLETTGAIEEDGDETRNHQLPTPARDQGPSECFSTPFPRTRPTSAGRGRRALPTPERSYLSSSPVKGLPSSPLQRDFNTVAHPQDSLITPSRVTYIPHFKDLQASSHFANRPTESLSPGAPICQSLRGAMNDFVSARDLPLGTPLHEIPTVPPRSVRKQEPRQQAQNKNAINKPFVSPVYDPDQVWFQTEGRTRNFKSSSKPRAGIVRGAVDLSASIRPDSEDEDPLRTDKARTRASTKDADVEAALDYEHRKQAATKHHSSQLLLTSSGTLENPLRLEDTTDRIARSVSSPHTNRYNAARAALKRPTPQPFINTTEYPVNSSVSEIPTRSSIPDGDPRAYLMRVHRQSTNQETANVEKGAQGLKIKRTKTVLLPLESTPIESRVKGLSLVIGLGMEGVKEQMKEAEDTEDYVCGGHAWGAFNDVREEELDFLEERLRGLLKEGGWRVPGPNDVDQKMVIDLRTALEEYIAKTGVEA